MRNGQKRKTSILCYLLIFIVFIPSVLYGQDSTNVFRTISISADYLNNSNHNIFHNYWKPTNGIDLNAKTEFYWGKIELGAQLFSINTQNIEQPDFVAVNMYIGWGLEHKLTSKLFLNSSFTVGNYFMNFDENNIDDNLKSESEFSFGLKAGLKYIFRNNMFLNLSGRYQIIYTFHRIELTYISIGLGKSFDMPDWLEEFLN
ncbi:MAG: porin family protein [candidate division Zixibacteria bacterium]|nr:porin family protein [candidate division Zixibacteria bacterium]